MEFKISLPDSVVELSNLIKLLEEQLQYKIDKKSILIHKWNIKRIKSKIESLHPIYVYDTEDGKYAWHNNFKGALLNLNNE